MVSECGVAWERCDLRRSVAVAVAVAIVIAIAAVGVDGETFACD